jgi:hypothetical protein
VAVARVKILFVARHFTYFRNYESVIAALAQRGHQIHLAAERDEYLGGRAMVERLVAEYPTSVSFGWIPDREDLWTTFVTKLRMTLDYLRYLEPAYSSTPKLRARAKERVPRLGLWLLAIRGTRTRSGRRFLRGVLASCERAVPRSRRIDAYLSEHRPDIVLFTPLLGVVISPQLDYLESAKAFGVPTALCVWSWDHLSSKAILRNIPDRVFVWNDVQRQEAVTMHEVPAERIVVTGAQCFDHWFDRRPSLDRSTFCASVGLPDRPYLLYVCSALFQGTVNEAQFVRRWIRELRTSGVEPLASTPILVRPHPARMNEWDDIDLSSEAAVAVWGRNPVDPEARDGYYNSLYHSAAVVGLNTSAFLEGAIVGRPIFATLLPEHDENQRGTIHFHYLMTVGAGLLHTTSTLPEHFVQVNASLVANEQTCVRSGTFVEAFIRPHGIEVAATPIFVREVEKLGALDVESSRDRIGQALLRAVLTPLAALARVPATAPLVSSAHERAITARDRAHRKQVAAAWQVKDALKEAEQRQKEVRLAQRQRDKERRTAEWRRAKAMNKLKQRIKKRIGLAS